MSHTSLLTYLFAPFQSVVDLVSLGSCVSPFLIPLIKILISALTSESYSQTILYFTIPLKRVFIRNPKLRNKPLVRTELKLYVPAARRRQSTHENYSSRLPFYLCVCFCMDYQPNIELGPGLSYLVSAPNITRDTRKDMLCSALINQHFLPFLSKNLHSALSTFERCHFSMSSAPRTSSRNSILC